VHHVIEDNSSNCDSDYDVGSNVPEHCRLEALGILHCYVSLPIYTFLCSLSFVLGFILWIHFVHPFSNRTNDPSMN